MDTPIATTRIAATSPQGVASTGVTAQGNALAGGNGVFSGLNGMSFIDLIFARITEGQDLKNDTAGIVTAQAQASPEDILAQLANTDSAIDMTLATDIAGELTINPETGELATDLEIANDTALPAINGKMQQLRSYIDSLLNGLPAEQRPQIVEIKPAEFKQIISQLQADLKAGDPTLVATGLTPEKLTALMAQVETAKQSGKLESFIMVKIVAPEAASNDKPVALLLPRALVAIQEQAQTGDDVAITDGETDAVAAALNKLVVGGDASAHAHAHVQTQTKTPQKPATPTLNTLSETPDQVSIEEGESKVTALKRALENVEENIGKHTEAGKKIPSGLENAAEKIKALVGAGLSTIAGSVPGSVEAAASWQDVFPEGMDMTIVGLGGKPLAIGSTSAMASLTTSAQHATYPHPATQAVAATISKAAAGGEDKAFTIKLDPPELGRVEVKMAIDKHNAIKAHLIIEKPETFMMLQRDAQILERSLQGIGLETGDGGLSFELAQDNMFQNEGDRGGERYQTGSKSGDGIESVEDVIETTMTWHVDPETGMQRYNILV